MLHLAFFKSIEIEASDTWMSIGREIENILSIHKRKYFVAFRVNLCTQIGWSCPSFSIKGALVQVHASISSWHIRSEIQDLTISRECGVRDRIFFIVEGE